MPLLLREPLSGQMAALIAADADVHVWWATRTECTSAIVRSLREGRIDAADLNWARDRLGRLFPRLVEVAPSEDIRLSAERLLLAYPLRAADAFQLAAALLAANGSPFGQPFVSLDVRLRDAAALEGFTLAPAAL